MQLTYRCSEVSSAACETKHCAYFIYGPARQCLAHVLLVTSFNQRCLCSSVRTQTPTATEIQASNALQYGRMQLPSVLMQTIHRHRRRFRCVVAHSELQRLQARVHVAQRVGLRQLRSLVVARIPNNQHCHNADSSAKCRLNLKTKHFKAALTRSRLRSDKLPGASRL